MKTIHKFRIEADRKPTTLRLKEGFRVVRCEYLIAEKGVYLWVEQSLKVVIPTVERQFMMAYSGDPVPDDFHYLDTALDPFGPEAYHVFEVPAQGSTAQVPVNAGIDLALPAKSRFVPLGTN
ncbi:hypothetical protein SAMN05216203_0288 [Marinobacter daqiaonensis]|uniref:DUF7352 domain-containing protein n=1 Tax=Marinobacter daqiaonensis TaxID=650891 RepID=A0A1I6GN46_9GAMM|nr:hypothetical protein [Marinobacter daqiaonensis]SFR43539.1 hypothetical protein SAMN05216203_0288 [Marinobacter daqiaonensis]